jgi:hypothetical protein
VKFAGRVSCLKGVLRLVVVRWDDDVERAERVDLALECGLVRGVRPRCSGSWLRRCGIVHAPGGFGAGRCPSAVPFTYHWFGSLIGCQSASSHVRGSLLSMKYWYLFSGCVRRFFSTCWRYTGHVRSDARCAMSAPVRPSFLQLMHWTSSASHSDVQCEPRHHAHWICFWQVLARWAAV